MSKVIYLTDRSRIVAREDCERKRFQGTREERFWAKVEKADGCWLWKGKPNAQGYGELRTGRKLELAHRVSWELAGQELIPGMTLDHLCRVRNCVNPDHLEQVTRGENVLRGVGVSAKNARKLQCDKGHPFTQENTYNTSTGRRYCRACKRQRDAAYRQQRKQAA